MEIKIPNFEEVEVLIRESYIDENGMIHEEIRTVMMPIFPDEPDDPASSEEKET